MPQTLASQNSTPLPERAEKCAKAALPMLDASDYRTLVAHAVKRARQMRGWTNDELAVWVSRDPRQVAKWQSGDERPHFDALFAIDDSQFRNALVVAMAELAGAEVHTTVIVRRQA